MTYRVTNGSKKPMTPPQEAQDSQRTQLQEQELKQG